MNSYIVSVFLKFPIVFQLNKNNKHINKNKKGKRKTLKF